MTTSPDAWIDISIPVRPGMPVWPGNPPVSIERAEDMARGDRASVSNLAMGAHTGTHMDAPAHFIRDGAGIDQMPFDAAIGPARVLPIENQEAIAIPELERFDIRQDERLLFKTRNSERLWSRDDFAEQFVHIAPDASEWLAERRPRCVGVDYLSVGSYQSPRDGERTHRALLGASIWIIEGLNLSRVAAGDYDLICLPLKIVGADGAPARAVLKPRSGD